MNLLTTAAETETKNKGAWICRLGWLLLVGILTVALLPEDLFTSPAVGHSLSTASVGTRGPVALAWMTGYQGGGERSSNPSSVAFSPDQEMVFVSGVSSEKVNRFQAVTIAYDAATGRPVWTANESELPGIYLSDSLVVCPTGKRLFTGGWLQQDHYRTYLVIAYSAVEGRRLWIREFPASPMSTSPLTIAPDGQRLFFSGARRSPLGEQTSFLIAQDASDGTVLWEREDTASGSAGIRNCIVVPCPTGETLFSVVSVADVDGDALGEWTVNAHDAADGKKRWESRHVVPGQYRPEDMVVASDGGTVFLAGTRFDSTEKTVGGLVISLNGQTGEERWRLRREGMHESARGLCFNATGDRILVSGDTASDALDGQRVGTVIAYHTQTGEVAWARKIPVIGRYVAAKSSAEEKVLVMIGARFGDPLFPGIVAISTLNGRERWQARYAKAGSVCSAPAAITVSPDGRSVAVTGVSTQDYRRAYSTILFRAKSKGFASKLPPLPKETTPSES